MRHIAILLLAACLTATAVAADPEVTVERAEARFVPWSGYWWPLHAGGLNGPLSQYDRVTGARALVWQRQYRPTSPDAPRWHGYCHAWAAASVMEPEPVRAVRAQARNGGNLLLSVGDQKGMLAACHSDNVANVYGRRTEPGDEPDGDLAPDVLWRLLKLYVGQQGVPLVLDIEPGPEVWNHPVYAYEVRYGRPDGSGTCQASLTLLLADDAVPPDYVGTKMRRQTYRFSFRMHRGSVVMGSGRWEGPSRQDHPDFAWYPYIARAENPQVQHSVVQQLVSRAPAPPDEPVMPEPEPSPPAAPPVPPAPAPQPQPPVPAPQPPAPMPQPHVAEQPVLLSPMELVAMVTNKTSSFGLDVTVDRFDGAHYHPGERFSVRGSSEQAGYLYLLHIDGRGELSLLYPLAGQDNRIAPQEPFTVPAAGDRFAFRVLPPPGMNRVKAVVTTRPLALTGLLAVPENRDPVQQQTRQKFRWHPAQRQQIQTLLIQYQQHDRIDLRELGAADPRELLGAFAQDEVAFYVEP